MELYWKTVQGCWIDWLIYAIGVSLFVVQILFYKWHHDGKRFQFVQYLSKWQQIFLVIAELLPLLGLLGTVLGLMQTFGNFQTMKTGAKVDLTLMIQNFAPALSTTLSGLLFVIPNLVINALLFNETKVFENEGPKR